MSIIGTRIVIDTNIFITIIGRKSPNRWIFNKIITGEFQLCISNEILLEYEEILTKKANSLVARNIIDFLLVSPFVHWIDVFYNWSLISVDKDDNKFVNCAITANAYCLLTNDKHFNILKDIDFPKVNIKNLKEFKKEFFK